VVTQLLGQPLDSSCITTTPGTTILLLLLLELLVLLLLLLVLPPLLLLYSLVLLTVIEVRCPQLLCCGNPTWRLGGHRHWGLQHVHSIPNLTHADLRAGIGGLGCCWCLALLGRCPLLLLVVVRVRTRHWGWRRGCCCCQSIGLCSSIC
jgi:hypothetical protein